MTMEASENVVADYTGGSSHRKIDSGHKWTS